LGVLSLRLSAQAMICRDWRTLEDDYECFKMFKNPLLAIFTFNRRSSADGLSSDRELSGKDQMERARCSTAKGRSH
jgi:hypothetical protein